MNTESQYGFFKYLYDEENLRYGCLETRARFYLTVLTFYLGALAVSGKDLLPLTMHVGLARWAVLASAIFFIIALVFCVTAARIRRYEGVTDPEELIREEGDSVLDDTDFFEDRIIDFAVAANRNSVQNNKVANVLEWTMASTLIGIGLHLVAFLAYVFKGP
ncbi:hypothetical protein PQR39_41400 [Paraburkholderia sediminicola]|uniref:hypothetical protein n=1 Tax=Paraburkholderia sediminicola TaxID=458836 RepID=UPI0038BD13DF